MDYILIHQDAAGNTTTSKNQISWLAFVKHATFAGIERPFFSTLPLRYTSLLFEFAPSFFWRDGFKLLPELAIDPTETAYISNRVGRAFADHLAKKLYKAKFTHSYECAMHTKGFPIKGQRPDFYCDTLTQQFSIEAKGFSKKNITDIAMLEHKKQSTKGPLPVHFSAASVAYDLYNVPKVKFYDPEGDDISYDRELSIRLRNFYYSRALDFIEEISDSKTPSDFSDYFAYTVKYPFTHARRILVHKAISERSWTTNDWLFSIKSVEEQDDSVYIDVDGIGLAF